MVNTLCSPALGSLDRAARIVRLYVAVAMGTVADLAVLSAPDPDQANQDAWVHAFIVAGFAVLLPLRLRAARHGSRRATTAVGIIATVLFAVNVIEASIPGLFPLWMRIEMVVVAVLMIGLLVTVAGAGRGRR